MRAFVNVPCLYIALGLIIDILVRCATVAELITFGFLRTPEVKSRFDALLCHKGTFTSSSVAQRGTKWRRRNPLLTVYVGCKSLRWGMFLPDVRGGQHGALGREGPALK